MIKKRPHIVVNGTATKINNKQRNGIGSLKDIFLMMRRLILIFYTRSLYLKYLFTVTYVPLYHYISVSLYLCITYIFALMYGVCIVEYPTVNVCKHILVVYYI